MKTFFLFLIILGVNSCDKILNGKSDQYTNENAEIFIHDGLEREYIINIPESYDSTNSYPLLLNFHGFGGVASLFMSESKMDEVSDLKNYILVCPQGSLLDGYTHWNAALETPENKSDVNDLDFIEKLIEHLSSNYAVDSKRIYACGFSNGAMFSYALACYTQNKIAAIGSMSGVLLDTSNTCNPSHEIPLIKFHGTQDEVLPFGGNSEFYSVTDIISFWMNKNNINGASDTLNLVSDNNFSIQKITHINSNGVSIENYNINNGGHEWFNLSIDEKNTSQIIWDFFDRFDLDGRRY
jgi:polyhydroxybutyrate depolymerase